ncbi:MarR family transcriptional regulator [Amycolatopsis sp. PS_44_ISF1]|uniref:MarR family winged helix-turn-helix transcriptional regulator n=1 Tax=Amycolatopsis sp. PS_44_ISF1 TaxID=2974917 RepID=UPI0028DDB405|nr:MarR family transcriptional regulator [Amycolatopsis sp. PS_44_ISF1]MDT8912734.1 MarR family transcriptional regulator [Amycolatopsis sp. PS_44_ISF1]
MRAKARTPEVASELRIVLGHLVRRLREQAEGADLTRSQTAVLLRLERNGPSTATALARAEGVRPQSMAKIVDALQEARLVGGSPDPKDGRKTVLSLTGAAREQFRTGRLAKQDWLSGAIDATLTAAEVDQLAAATRLLKRLANTPDP